MFEVGFRVVWGFLAWKIAVIKAHAKWTSRFQELKLTFFVKASKRLLRTDLAWSLNIYKNHRSVTSQAWIVYVVRTYQLKLHSNISLLRPFSLDFMEILQKRA